MDEIKYNSDELNKLIFSILSVSIYLNPLYVSHYVYELEIDIDNSILNVTVTKNISIKTISIKISTPEVEEFIGFDYLKLVRQFLVISIMNIETMSPKIDEIFALAKKNIIEI